jgi:outer membrane protein OmpA-like peptidoglycan-associated protein
MFQEAVGSNFADQASNILGESSDSAQRALEAILPSLMGSMIQKGASEEGAAGLLDFISKGNHDGGILDNLGDLLGGGADALGGLLSSGGGILKYLVGDKLGSLLDLISGSSGMKTSSANSLIKMVAPLLMGFVGRYIKKNGLNAGSLIDLLLGQREFVSKAAPSGISDLLGFAGLSKLGPGVLDTGKDMFEAVADAGKQTFDKVEDVAENSAETAGRIADAGVDTGKSMVSRIGPWLLLAIAAMAIIYLLNRGCGGNAVSDAADTMMDKTEQAAEKVGEAATDAAGAVADAFRSISLPGGAEIKAAAGSFTAKFADFLGKGEGDMAEGFVFDRVSFETGSDRITAESQDQLGNLASMLKAYPGVSIRVEGHTDNTGDANINQRISTQRALAVKSALIDKGVEGSRIQAVGRGQSAPIASNDTEGGRTANRRVEVYVTGK